MAGGSGKKTEAREVTPTPELEFKPEPHADSPELVEPTPAELARDRQATTRAAGCYVLGDVDNVPPANPRTPPEK